MKDYMKDLFLDTPVAKRLYEGIKDLPILDYHCHLDASVLREDKPFGNLTDLWLAGDHYKWRAMRLAGVEEALITGDAEKREKFRAYASVLPRFVGNPLYYWSHLELKTLFGIEEPLNRENADRVYDRANEILSTLKPSDLMRRFRVAYFATTDDPAEPLGVTGTVSGVRVSPTFRPDKVFLWEGAYLEKLGRTAGVEVTDLASLKRALSARLDDFVSHGARASDHGFDFFPERYADEREAEEIFAHGETATPAEKDALRGHLMLWLFGEYKKRGMTAQLHFSTMRNVNSAMFGALGPDAGFDVLRPFTGVESAARFLDTLTRTDALPKTVLYTLDKNAMPALAALTGAFREVRLGAAWWFNDTVSGIREQLAVTAEYACFGNNLGMLTDSRSYASYVRFDFFRRILAGFVGGYVERGEYDPREAETLMRDICYNNAKEFFGL